MATQQETLQRLLLSCLATLMLACGLIPFASAGEANAYSHSGCRVAKSSVSVFNQSLAAKYNTATNGGKTRWNAQALKVAFSTASSASAADVLVVAGAPSSVTYWAVTEGTCSGGKYTSRVTIRWHTLNTSGLGATPLRMIATHEFGHVLGLGHVTRACTIASSARAVMVQGDFKWSCDWGTEPWADDVNGVKALYT